jgi:hypothetical protein
VRKLFASGVYGVSRGAGEGHALWDIALDIDEIASTVDIKKFIF